MKLTAALPEGAAPPPARPNRIDYAVLAGVGLVAALFTADRLTPEKPAADRSEIAAAAPQGGVIEADAASEPVPDASIAVLPFADMSAGADQYRRAAGFPPQCKPVGTDDFACE